MGYTVELKDSFPKSKEVGKDKDKYCLWCYEISAEGNIRGTFGLDFDPKLQVYVGGDSKDFKDIDDIKDTKKETTKKTLPPKKKGGKGEKVDDRLVVSKTFDGSAKKGEICFLTKGDCAKPPKKAPISLDHLEGTSWVPQDIDNSVQEKGDPENTKRIPGPVAAVYTPPTDIVAILARYQGLKQAYMLAQAIELLETRDPDAFSLQAAGGPAPAEDVVVLDDEVEHTPDEDSGMSDHRPERTG